MPSRSPPKCRNNKVSQCEWKKEDGAAYFPLSRQTLTHGSPLFFLKLYKSISRVDWWSAGCDFTLGAMVLFKHSSFFFATTSRARSRSLIVPTRGCNLLII